MSRQKRQEEDETSAANNKEAVGHVHDLAGVAVALRDRADCTEVMAFLTRAEAYHLAAVIERHLGIEQHDPTRVEQARDAFIDDHADLIGRSLMPQRAPT